MLNEGVEMVLVPDNSYEVMYTNWKGVTKKRNIHINSYPYFGSNKYHTTPQWLVDGICDEKFEMRSFALKDMFPV